MNLGGTILVVLAIILVSGVAAGLYILFAGDRARPKAQPLRPEVPEENIPGEELPPREDAWKPEVWYSEAAQGTLFPNQPSPNFRISADSSFQRAITRRELEDLAVEEPTKPQLALARQNHVPAEESPPPSIPDEVEALSETPTLTMKITPIKDDLPTTVKMRAVRRNRFIPPESEALSNGSAPTNDVPAEIADMESYSFSAPMASPEYDSAPEETPREDSADTIVLMAVDGEDIHVDGFHSQEDSHFTPEDWPSDIFVGAETDVVEVPGRESDPVVTAFASAEPDPGLTWIPVETPEDYRAEDSETYRESVMLAKEPEEYRAPAELVEEQPVGEWLEPVELMEEQPLPVDVAEVDLTPVEADVGLETEPPPETDEHRYDRLLQEVYSQAIHLGYDADLDAISVQFTNCPVMESSDVPWIFQTIGVKIQELFPSDAWQQHGLLLDVAGLQVAPEAEASWEMVLDGFVTQLCPEVAPRIALAIQYDSSIRHAAGEEDDTIPELQRASSVTGQPRPLVVARSYEAALLLLQLMRREI